MSLHDKTLNEQLPSFEMLVSALWSFFFVLFICIVHSLSYGVKQIFLTLCHETWQEDKFSWYMSNVLTWIMYQNNHQIFDLSTMSNEITKRDPQPVSPDCPAMDGGKINNDRLANPKAGFR